MKNSTLSIPLLAAVAGATLLLDAAAQAQPPKISSRAVISEDGATRLTRRAVTANRSPVPLAAAPSEYPRYQLIDLGTLGGPTSFYPFAARNINARQVVGISETAVPDPNCFLDCYIFHGILRRGDGSIVELHFPRGVDPASNYSFVGDLTPNGLLGGFVTNGQMDPLTDFPQLRPVVWGANGIGVFNLGTLGGNSGQVAMLNRRGAAVGMALNDIPENPDFAIFMNAGIPAATQSRPFLWEGSRLHDLGTLGGNDAIALAINDSWTIFGMSYTDTVPNDTTGLPTTHPFLWKNGRMQDLGTLGGTLATPGSFASGPFGAILNERGQAIGTSYLPGDESWHAFLWDNGTMIDLGTLGGNSEPLAINQLGLVVGRADVSPDSPYHHAVLWRNGTIHELGVVAPCQNSTATAVNSHSDVVGGLGGCTDDPADLNYYSAFTWQHGSRIVDLNSLVTPPSDMHMEFAEGINDEGEIAATAYTPTGDAIHQVLLVPQQQ